MPKQSRNWPKTAGLFGFGSILTWSAYETYQAIKVLRRPLNTNCLDLKRSEFIYLKHDFFRAPVKDIMNEIFQDEPKILGTADKINSLLYAIKRKFTFTNLEYGLKTLRIAKYSNDSFLRLKALRRLANLEDLDDWEFQYLAQFCDARTVTSLARLNSNPNWFLRPRELQSLSKSKFDLVRDFRLLLDNLSQNECVQFILDTTFSYDKIKDPDDEVTSYGITRKENDLILQSLDALLHLTTNNQLCNEIAKNNGLDLMLDIYKHFTDNTNIKLILNKIVTNMTSSCRHLIEHFYKSGWIYLLSKWQNDIDLRIQILASTALTNLDVDDHFAFRYPPKVYPLYPKGKYHKKPELDLIFVHGLLGGIFITWRQQSRADSESSGKKVDKGKKNGIFSNGSNANLHNSFYEEEALFKSEKIIEMDHSESSESHKNLFQISEEASKEIFDALHGSDTELDLSSEVRISKRIFSYLKEKFIEDDSYTFCWPLDWLPLDFPDIRILGLNYESALSMWTATKCPCERSSGKLVDRSRIFLNALSQAKIGENGRPVVWVGHSMGGLLIKYIVNQALESDDPKIRQIGENTAGVLFLGTPHKGSTIAKLSQQASVMLWPTIEVQDLEEKSKELLKMNETFLKNIKNSSKAVKIVSIAEGNSTKIPQIYMKLHIVTLDSAYLGVGDFYVSSENHLNLSKPVSKKSFIYRTIVKMLEEVISDDHDQL